MSHCQGHRDDMHVSETIILHTSDNDSINQFVVSFQHYINVED